MSSPDERSVRAVSDVYSEPGVEWQVRFMGTHLHPGFEEATVALASRAAHYGFPEGGAILDLASALGDPRGSSRGGLPPRWSVSTSIPACMRP